MDKLNQDVKEFFQKQNDNPEYTRKILKDYNLARKEFEKIGVKINQDDFNEFVQAFETLEKVSNRVLLGGQNKFKIKPNWIPIYVSWQLDGSDDFYE
ncbi:MAG: hypothetical protein ACPKPY_05310 [Nitrososphaeraceae archaeon]